MKSPTMAQENPPRFKLIQVVALLSDLQSAGLFTLIVSIWNFTRYHLAAKAKPGIYEVLDFQSRLELHDTAGKQVTYHKQQKVRFLQNNVIAYEDVAWGEGDIFADYQVSPGVVADKFKEGHRYRILISIRATKNRDDMEVFNIRRSITDGFTQENEDIQTEINHHTRKVTVSVVFPAQRLPKQVILVEQNTGRTTKLGAEHFALLPDGRQEVTWQLKHPKLHEAYIIRWWW